MKLINIINIEGAIILKTGLHIGAGDTELHIGGTDHPVVKHPFTREPYIPGSSLKGKIRSLLELKSGLIPIQGKDGYPIGLSILNKDLSENQKKEAIKILKLFGVSASDTNQQDIPGIEPIGPARASFKDAYLDEESKRKVKDKQCSYFEIKSENCVDRIYSVAKNPRFIERVVAGLKFNFSIFLKEMEGDEDLLDYLLKGIKLLELDALGASGSRGYGRVEFRFFDPEISNRFNNINPFTEG